MEKGRGGPGIILNPWEYYLRWRHSKGYGVHSPYAYRFIKDVLRPGSYGYYAYDTLDNLTRGDKESRWSNIREARFLIRLAMFLNTKRILCQSKSSGRKNSAASWAAKALKLTFFNFEKYSDVRFREGDLLVVTPGKEAAKQEARKQIEPELLKTALEAGVTVFAPEADKDIRAMMSEPLQYGLLLSGHRNVLLIPRSEMRYLSYEILF